MNDDIQLENDSLQLLIRQLEECFAKGDLKAADPLFFAVQEESEKWLLGIAKTAIAGEDAYDVVSEAYIGLYDHLREGKTVDRIRPFLRTLVTRRAIDTIRKRKTTVSSFADYASEDGEIVSARSPDALGEIDDRLALEQMRNTLLEQLPSPEREILFLRHYFDLSVAETMTQLNLSEDVVKKGTRKAKILAQQIVTQSGVKQ